MVAAEQAFLGDNLIAWLLLALGAAMAVGNILAVVRPPEEPRKDRELERAPVGRSLAFAALGAIAAIWALASLLGG